MGNLLDSSSPPFDLQTEKRKLEVNCLKVKGFLEIHRGKRHQTALAKEKAYIQMISSQTRHPQEELEKLRMIVSDENYVKAADILIRHSENLMNYSLMIIEHRNELNIISNIIGMVENLVWAVKPMNLDCLVEFRTHILTLFGENFLENAEKSSRIDNDLKECFKNIFPDFNQINDYVNSLSVRTGIPFEKINEGQTFIYNGIIAPKNNGNNSNQPQPPPNGGEGNGSENKNIPQINDDLNKNQNENNNLPKLDDFEERLKKLRGN